MARPDAADTAPPRSEVIQSRFSRSEPMRSILAASMLTLLVGCSTSPVTLNEAISAPAARVTGYQAAVDGGAKIVVIRDSGFSGGGCYATVFINGNPVARLNPKEKAEFNVSPGEWTLGAALQGSGLCGLNSERLETELSLKSGQTKTYRIYKPGDGDVGIKPTTF